MDNRGRAETCIELLERWDAGHSVWTVEMGGLGPGYEQAIQVLAIECLRELVAKDFEWTGTHKDGETTEADKRDSDTCRALLDPVVSRVDKWPGCGFSGAQVGAAMHLAAKFHRFGPIWVYDNAPEDRRIQVSKDWPREPDVAKSPAPECDSPATETGPREGSTS